MTFTIEKYYGDFVTGSFAIRDNDGKYYPIRRIVLPNSMYVWFKKGDRIWYGVTHDFHSLEAEYAQDLGDNEKVW